MTSTLDLAAIVAAAGLATAAGMASAEPQDFDLQYAHPLVAVGVGTTDIVVPTELRG